MTSKQVGENIRRIRKQMGISRVDLGRRAGRTRQAIALIETGEVGASLDTVLRLATALGVQPESLFRRASDP